MSDVAISPIEATDPDPAPRLWSPARLVRHRGARSYFVVVAFSGLTSLLSFAASVILARRLGPSGFGQFALFYSLVQVVWTATNFGDSAYVRYVNTHPDTDSRKLLAATMQIEFALAIVIVAIAYPLSGVLAQSVFGGSQYRTAVFLGLLVGGALNPVTLMAATHQAREHYVRYAVVNVVYYGLAFVGVVGAAVVVPRLLPVQVFVVYVVAAVAASAFATARLARLANPFRLDRRVIGMLLRFGKWLIGANAAYLVFQRLDVLVLARVGSAADVGEYGVALRLTVIASLLTSSLAPALLPRAARTRGSDANLRQYLKYGLTLSASILVFVALLAAAAGPIVGVLYGSRYTAAVELAQVLLIATAAIAVYTPLSQLFLADERPRGTFYLALVRLVSTVALLAVLAPSHGAAGCAWATAGSEVATLLFVIGRVRTRHQPGRAVPA
jgi:O-antigen/teichoic acid export membrane protein